MKRPLVIALLVLALLFILAGIGAVVLFALRAADFAIFEVPLVSATAEESKSIKVDTDKPVTLNVNNDAGKVSIVGADVEAVEIQIIKTGYAPTQAGAEEHLQTIKADVTQNGNVITLTYKLNGPQTRMVDTVDFLVTVPTETIVDVEKGSGDIFVSDLIGSVDISSSFSNMTVKNIKGALTLYNSGGDTEVSSVNAGTEDVTIETDFGQIALKQISGQDIKAQTNNGSIKISNLRASGDFFAKSDFASVEIEQSSAGSVTIESQSGSVALTKFNIRGNLTITCDFGEIKLEQAMAASYDLDTNGGNISMDGAKGNLKAHTDFGNITIENADQANLDLRSNSGGIDFNGSLGEGPHRVTSDFGIIVLAIPADSTLSVDLKTDFGNIESEIPVTVTLTGTSETNHQAGTMNGGGADLTVKTNNGNISISAIK